MKIKVWGARGSIPAPLKPEDVEAKLVQTVLALPQTLDTGDSNAVRAYIKTLPPLMRGTAGGNTSCVQIKAGSEASFIIDAGSGLRELGLALMKGPCGRGQGVIHLFFSHPHWDHIQGFPFFVPAFIPGNKIFIYSVHNLRAALTEQQRSLNFPVSLSYMQAGVEFITLEVGQPFGVGDLTINTIPNAHPGVAYSYRFEDKHSVFVYANDAEYKHLDDPASIRPYLNFFKNADALVFDAQYTLTEVWQMKEDWGHSSAMIGVDMARAAGVKKLILFHHDPTISDAQLQQIQTTAMAYQKQDTTLPPCDVIVAYEGLELDLTPPGIVELELLPGDAAAVLTPGSVFDTQGLNRLEAQLQRLQQDSLAHPIIDLSHIETLTTANLKSLIALRRREQGGQIILANPSDNAREVIKLSGYLDFFAIYPTVEAALDAIKTRDALNLPGHILKKRYRIERKVGQGRMGTVLKATDLKRNRPVALKIFSPSFSRETIHHLSTQIRHIINLNDPNIVHVFDWDSEGGTTFKVEEFITAPTLQNALTAGDPPLSPAQTLDIAAEIALALEHAHSAGVIHGDLKPRNIFLTATGTRLSGFGLGRLEEGRNLVNAPLLFLSAPYLAPEQIVGRPLDPRTDLYALGVILYRLFTGQLPFTGSDEAVTEAHLHRPPPPPRQLNPDLSLTLEHLILKLLAKNPADRYDGAQQIRRILGSLIIKSQETFIRRRQPLVGRSRQLKTLQAHWEQARQGQGCQTYISGQPGIGKTALAQHLAANIEHGICLTGRCRKYKGRIPYRPFLDALLGYLTTLPPQHLTPGARHALGNLTSVLPELKQLLPDLPAPAPLEPRHEQLRFMASLTEFINLAAQHRPWLLFLDDLQWADRASLDLLLFLSRHLPTMPLFILGVYHEAEQPPDHPLQQTLRHLKTQPTFHHLPLKPLAPTGTARLLSNIWNQTVPPPLAEKIHHHTGGNPFYTQEVAKGLVDDGFIILQNGLWQFPEPGEVRLPHNAREAVWRRIRHLGPDTQTLLRQTSVLGHTFKFKQLQAISALPAAEVMQLLDPALERQLVHEVPAPEPSLSFRHAEIRHVLYADIGPMQRLRLHRQAAEMLEQQARPAPERIAEELAHHFGEAGQFARALPYTIRAARRAETACVNQAALDWYTRALDMLARLKPQEAAQYQSLRLPVHQSLGSVLAQLNRRDEALQHTQRAVELAVEQGQQLEEGVSRRAQGEIYRALGNPDAAAAALRHSLQILSDLDNPYQVAKTRLALARLALESGAPADADPLLTQAIETFKTLEAHFDLAEAQKLTRQL